MGPELLYKRRTLKSYHTWAVTGVMHVRPGMDQTRVQQRGGDVASEHPYCSVVITHTLLSGFLSYPSVLRYGAKLGAFCGRSM